MQSSSPSMSRRQLLRAMGSGFGMLALSNLLAETKPGLTALAPRTPHFPAKTKNVIFLFLNGGPSHVDSFAYKPMLEKYDGQPYPSGNLETERRTGHLMCSPFKFKKCGENGIEVSEIFTHLGDCIDDICVIKSMYTDMPFHEPSLFYVELRSENSWASFLGFLDHVWIGDREPESAGLRRIVSRPSRSGTTVVDVGFPSWRLSGDLHSEQRCRSRKAGSQSAQSQTE